MVGKQGRARPPELGYQRQLRLISHRISALAVTGAIAAIAIACGGSVISGIPLADPQFLDHDDCLEIDTRPLPIAQIVLEYRDIKVRIGGEIASEVPQRTQGLMCRSEIGAGTGMYFELPSESTGGFWMFNTYVPLDILYLDPDGFTVEIATLAPCPRSEGEPDRESDDEWRLRCTAESEPHAPTDRPYLDVLELPAGWLESQGIPLDDAIGLLRVERR